MVVESPTGQSSTQQWMARAGRAGRVGRRGRAAMAARKLPVNSAPAPPLHSPPIARRSPAAAHSGPVVPKIRRERPLAVPSIKSGVAEARELHPHAARTLAGLERRALFPLAVRALVLHATPCLLAARAQRIAIPTLARAHNNPVVRSGRARLSPLTAWICPLAAAIRQPANAPASCARKRCVRHFLRWTKCSFVGAAERDAR